MKLPETLTITVLERSTNLPAEGLAIVLELFATRKNNYIVGPGISNFSGQVEFTRDECEFSIRADQQMFIMDYVDNIVDCKTYLEVRLHSPEHLSSMLQQYRVSPAFWGMRFRNAVKLFKELERVKNAEFQPASLRVDESQLLADPNINLWISRKS